MTDKFSLQPSTTSRDLTTSSAKEVEKSKNEPNVFHTKYGTVKLSERNISDLAKELGKTAVATVGVVKTVLDAQGRIAVIREASNAKIREMDKEIERIM